MEREERGKTEQQNNSEEELNCCENQTAQQKVEQPVNQYRKIFENAGIPIS